LFTRSKRQVMRKVAALAITAVFASVLALATPAGAQTPSSPTTNRIHGADRYATAVALARSINSVSDGLIVASGNSSADALAAASVATANRPVLLVPKDSIPESVSDFISDYKSSLAAAAAAKVYFVGGEAAISAANYTALTTMMTTAGDLTPPTFSRLSGADRYATAAAVYAKGPAAFGDKIIVVSGESWADGVSAAALSAESGWPVVLQTKNGNNASAKASIDAYLALPASTKSFVIVGGEAAISTDTEEYLINTKGVPVANIRRIAGSDRYDTSMKVNLYADAQNIGGIDLVQVALVSGESPWDALAASSWAAAKDAAVQLSPAAGGNASVSALGARVGALSKAGAVTNTESVGDVLYLIGGKTALNNAARDGFRAASANNLTSTLTGCVEGGKTMVLTLSGGLSTTENTAAVVNNEGFEDLVTLNSAAAHGDTTVTKLATGSYLVNMANAALAITNGVPDTVKFKGVTEDVAFGGNNDIFERSIGSSSCTIANDATRPTATLVGYTGTIDVDDGDTADNPYWILTTSEPTTVTVAAGKMVCTAGNGKAMVVTRVSGAKAGTAAGTKFMIHHGGAAGNNNDEDGLLDANVQAGDVCTLNADQITDLGALNPAASISTTMKARDATGPTLTATGVSCVHTTAQNTLTKGNLSIAATATGAYTGAEGNSWKMTVVQQRGILQPDITVDTTAKMITVTGDTGYHTANDVAARWASLNMTSGWTVGASTGLISATLTPAVGLAGQSTCTVSVTLNEPGTMADAALNVSVAGLDAGYVGDPACVSTHDSAACHTFVTTTITTGLMESAKITFTTKSLGLGSLSLADVGTGLTNADAVRGLTPITFTVG